MLCLKGLRRLRSLQVLRFGMWFCNGGEVVVECEIGFMLLGIFEGYVIWELGFLFMARL